MKSYKDFKVNVNGTLSSEALDNYYAILIPSLIDKYGKEPVIAALKHIVDRGE